MLMMMMMMVAPQLSEMVVSWMMMMSLNADFQDIAFSSFSSSGQVHPTALQVPYPSLLAEEDFWFLYHGHFVVGRLSIMTKVHVVVYVWISVVLQLCCRPLR